MPHEWFKHPNVKIVLGLSAILLLAACAELDQVETDADAAPASDPTPEPAGARTEKVCPKSTYFESLSLSKPVLTPDITLGSTSAIEQLEKSNGWFVINLGTDSKPQYQLGRVYPDGSVKMGQKVSDLSLLGPSSIPEVSRSDPGFRAGPQTVSEEEMRVFYQYPQRPGWRLPLGFDDGLERRASTFGKPIDAGTRSITDSDVIRLRNTVFESVGYAKEQPSSHGPSGPCRQPYYATASLEPKWWGESLTNKEYPELLKSNSEVQSWVRAHELGHGLARVTDAPTVFNELPFEKRAQILEELKKLHETLKADKKLHAYDTANEIVADLYAYMLKDPAYVQKHAPNAAAFFKSLVANDPQLSKILTFK
jgi:hypothetical protein